LLKFDINRLKEELSDLKKGFFKRRAEEDKVNYYSVF